MNLDSSHSDKVWFAYLADGHAGPFTEQEIIKQFYRQEIQPTTLIWKSSLPDWTPLENLSEFTPWVHGGLEFIEPDQAAPQSTVPSSVVVPEHIKKKMAFIQLSGIEENLRKDIKRTEGRALLKILTIAVLILFVLTLAVYEWLRPRPNTTGLTNSEANQLSRVIETSLSANGPTADTLLARTQIGEPFFYVATNLNKEPLSVYIEGLADTLVGAFHFSVQSTVVFENGLAQTTVLRRTNGQELAPGKYRVLVVCSSCTTRFRVLSDKTYFISSQNQQQYERSLAEFHRTVESQAGTEAAEIKQIFSTLDSQIHSTTTQFQQLLGNGSKKNHQSWREFHRQWSQLEGQIATTFQDWSDEKSIERYFYFDMYKNLKSLVEKALALHGMQNVYLTSGVTNATTETKIAVDAATLETKVQALRVRVDSLETLRASARVSSNKSGR